MLLIKFTDWLQAHQLHCPIKLFFNVDCPGCGLQRSCVELLKGNWAASFQLHPVTVPLILFMLFSTLHLYFKVRNGNTIIVYSYIFIALIVLGNFIYKLTTSI